MKIWSRKTNVENYICMHFEHLFIIYSSYNLGMLITPKVAIFIFYTTLICTKQKEMTFWKKILSGTIWLSCMCFFAKLVFKEKVDFQAYGHWTSYKPAKKKAAFAALHVVPISTVGPPDPSTHGLIDLETSYQSTDYDLLGC